MANYSKSDLNKIKRGPKRATYDKDQINTILDAGFIAHVAYNYNGRAITIPMAFGRQGNHLILHGSLKNRMLLALLSAKEASMTIMHLDALVLARSGFHHSVNYRCATLFGSVKRIEDSKEKTRALKCVIDHMIENRWEHLRTMSEKELNGTMVVQFSIETASAKIRNVGVSDEPEDHKLDIWAGLVPLKQVVDSPISDDLLAPEVEIPEHVWNYYKKHKA